MSSSESFSVHIMASRWKAKALTEAKAPTEAKEALAEAKAISKAKALAKPMSVIVSQLRSSLIESNSQGLLSGCSVLLAAHPHQTDIFNQACFGRPVISAEKDKQWFQLSLEEALYLCSVMRCIEIIGENKCAKDDGELWRYMTSKKVGFPFLFKAYSHLRMKNWVVRAGSQYGVDFVAYRHHPALVHSDYVVIVLSDGHDNRNARLMTWSDFHCTVRLCGGVAKTLLVLHVSRMGNGAFSDWSLDDYRVEERIVTRWNIERSWKRQTMV